jgi:hypothetical protein
MASQYDKVMLPRGLEVAIQTDPTTPNVYTDLGVIYNDGTMEFTYDSQEYTGSQGERLLSFINNMQATASFDLVQLKLENIHKLMSGASDLVIENGTPVAVTGETIVAGAWDENVFIPFANQNGNGTVPTSISVANDGALIAGDDYLVTESGGIWGIVVVAGKGDVSEDLVLNYTYTPAVSKKITVGSPSVEVVPRSLRIRQNQGTESAPKYLTAIIHSATNENGLSLTFNRFDSDSPQLVPITMVGKVDPSRTDLDQLFSFEVQE